jgi:hypothetical protein
MLKNASNDTGIRLDKFGEWVRYFLTHNERRFVIYGDPTTGKSTVCKWLKENRIIKPSEIVDSDDLIIERWGIDRIMTFFSTATDAEFDEYHRLLLSHRMIFTNHEDYILGGEGYVTWAFTRTKDVLRLEYRKRDEKDGRIWRSSDYPWLPNWCEKQNAIILEEGEYMAEVLEWLASFEYPHSEYHRLLRWQKQNRA